LASGRPQRKAPTPRFTGTDAVLSATHMTDILECLKKHGQRLDFEIARETGVPLATVRERLIALAATGAVITCRLTRFENGARIEAMQCRVSGYIPPLAPGRKAAPKM